MCSLACFTLASSSMFHFHWFSIRKCFKILNILCIWTKTVYHHYSQISSAPCHVSTVRLNSELSCGHWTQILVMKYFYMIVSGRFEVLGVWACKSKQKHLLVCFLSIWRCWVSTADGCPYILLAWLVGQIAISTQMSLCASLQTSFGMQMSCPNKANLSAESNSLTASFEEA